MNNKINNILLSIFIIIEPFLDTYFMYNEPSLELFGFRISTIIRILFLGILGILLLKETKLKKYRKCILAYIILFFIYIIFHHKTATQFTSLVPGNFNYSFLSEIFYLIRFIFPLFLIYHINSIPLKAQTFKKTIITLSLIISLSVIISNIFYLSRSSYYEFTITYNIIDWFFNDISFANASTRGFFYATIVITNLLLITPYIYNLYYTEGKYLYLTVIICNMLALFMAGTRACTFGFIIIAIAMLIMYIFFSIIKKEKFKFERLLSTGLIILISFLILPNSPAVKRILLNNEIQLEQTSKPSTDNKYEITEGGEILTFEEIYNLENQQQRESNLKTYFEQHYNSLNINKHFILEAYPYNYDYNFWADVVMNEPIAKTSDNRYIEAKILDRVKEVNNNKLDNYFGITYTRTSNIFNLEQDFVYQYYSLGIIGVILFLGPIIGILLLCIFKILTNKNNFTLENCSLCLGIGLLLCVAFYSGNMIDNLGITIILGYMLGYLSSKVFNAEKENSK